MPVVQSAGDQIYMKADCWFSSNEWAKTGAVICGMEVSVRIAFYVKVPGVILRTLYS